MLSKIRDKITYVMMILGREVMYAITLAEFLSPEESISMFLSNRNR